MSEKICFALKHVAVDDWNRLTLVATSRYLSHCCQAAYSPILTFDPRYQPGILFNMIAAHWIFSFPCRAYSENPSRSAGCGHLIHMPNMLPCDWLFITPNKTARKVAARCDFSLAQYKPGAVSTPPPLLNNTGPGQPTQPCRMAGHPADVAHLFIYLFILFLEVRARGRRRSPANVKYLP